MFDRDELDQLLAAMRRHGVTTMEIEGAGGLTRLSLEVTATTPETAPRPETTAARSPDIGTFLPCGADDGLPSIAPGDQVREGAILGYVARGILRAPVIAPVDGTVSAEIPETGAIFGYGDTVFTLEVTR